MENLNINIGLKSYQLVEGGDALCFNPGDPNVYARFIAAIDEIKAVEIDANKKAKKIQKDDKDASKKSLEIMREADRRFKEILNGVFDAGNDFDRILLGVNLMAVTESGSRVIENVINALTPILENGVKDFVDAEVKEAKLNREQRRAMKK